MRNIRFIPTAIIGGALSFGSSAHATERSTLDSRLSTLNLEYVTEWQTDFKGGYDWLNLLKTSADIPLCNAVSFQASTISTAKTGGDPLISDMLSYSNIEAENIPLTFARAGFNMTFGGAQLFVGINNVNEDYFVSPLTSFFTNSSCGISPTISCNFDVANYPLASWCVHYAQQIQRVSVQTSLYPGQGYSRIFGHDNIFKLNFKDDGLFSITSIDYKHNGINLILGVALHCGRHTNDETTAQGVSSVKKDKVQTAETSGKWRAEASPWILGEIDLPCNLGVHVHGSLSTVKDGCKRYAGAGLIYSGWQRVHPGASFNYAYFTSGEEYATEFTCRIPLRSDNIFLQPAVHLIKTTGEDLKTVGMMRVCLVI